MNKYSLSTLEKHEKGVIVVLLKTFAERAKSVPGGAETVRMLEDYQSRIEKDDSFTYEELCNIGLAAGNAINVLQSAGVTGLPATLMLQTSRTAYGKLEKIVAAARIKEGK